MKATTLSALFLAMVTITATGYAADGTINFTGSIIDETCTVDSGSQNLNVDLGKVSKTSLDGAAGKKAASSSFTLSLSKCPETVTTAKVKFDGTSDSSNQQLLALNSDTGVASGVGIEIADSSGNPIALHTASPDIKLTGGANSLNFIARYVSTGTVVTAGNANGTSQFTINYK
ncbi:fimbrial protein [Enterobacter chuandaensis]|uniref:fimbrial protein n=1 Tax=Enterobacter chuandaensis TaxID=2497875 RepID=UPI0020755533|nr:fimbrial protein [Enterobacter chuandaensis]MCM7587701.1 fimbrial protein [Enterobacter chuandaensis]